VTYCKRNLVFLSPNFLSSESNCIHQRHSLAFSPAGVHPGPHSGLFLLPDSGHHPSRRRAVPRRRHDRGAEAADRAAAGEAGRGHHRGRVPLGITGGLQRREDDSAGSWE